MTKQRVGSYNNNNNNNNNRLYLFLHESVKVIISKEDTELSLLKSTVQFKDPMIC